MSLNYLDILLAIPLAWGLINGFRKGLVKSITSLVALIVGILGAIYFSKFIAEILSDKLHIASQNLPIIAFIVTFILCVIGVHLLGTLLHKLIVAVALGFINRLLGGVFGLLKTALVLSVILVMFNYFNDATQTLPQTTRNSSLLYNPVSKLAPAIFPHLNFKSDEWTKWKNKLMNTI